MGAAGAPTQAEVDAAVDAAWAEDEAFKRDIRAKGEEMCIRDSSETVKAELLSDVLDRLKNLGDIQGSEVVRLPPLFADEGEYARFKQRHDGE